MTIKIIFPKQFFTKEQLQKLGKDRVEFFEGKDIDLEKIDNLFASEPYILVVDPTYLKDHWDAFPLDRVKRMKGLKALCLTTTSFSWVDGVNLKEMGIIVTNTPGKSTEAVAEFNIFMMFALLRRLPLVAKNDWQMNYDEFLNEEATGLTAGIVGMGKIGTRVAELCQGLGMNVCYWNRTNKQTPFKAETLEGLFAKADVVFNTLATPPELKFFLNKDLLATLKESAIIVSTSDIHVFDEAFLISQVEKGKLGGYAFESRAKQFTEYKGNIMVFPEQAYFTRGTLFNTARIVTETVVSVIKGEPINRVN